MGRRASRSRGVESASDLFLHSSHLHLSVHCTPALHRHIDRHLSPVLIPSGKKNERK